MGHCFIIRTEDETAIGGGTIDAYLGVKEFKEAWISQPSKVYMLTVAKTENIELVQDTFEGINKLSAKALAKSPDAVTWHGDDAKFIVANREWL